MELKGKKIAFLGDSITQGVGATSVDKVYWKVLEALTGAHCYGYGISGTRIAKQRKPSDNPSFDRYFASRVEEMIPDAEVVVVFGGINDYGHGDAPFGNHGDRTEDTFCGAVHLLMEKLIEKYPLATIVFMTPLHYYDEDNVGYNSWGVRRMHPLERYVDAIREAAAYYSLPVLDMYRTSGIQPRVPVIRRQFMPDGLHPNDAGHLRIAHRLMGFLGSL